MICVKNLFLYYKILDETKIKNLLDECLLSDDDEFRKAKFEDYSNWEVEA